jgi:hypothetical protein
MEKMNATGLNSVGGETWRNLTFLTIVRKEEVPAAIANGAQSMSAGKLLQGGNRCRDGRKITS